MDQFRFLNQIRGYKIKLNEHFAHCKSLQSCKTKAINSSLFILFFANSNISAQDIYLDDGIKKIVATLDAKYWKKDITNIAILGFRMKSDTSENVCQYVKDMFMKELSSSRFTAIDPTVVNKLVNDRPWKLTNVTNYAFMHNYEAVLFRKVDVSVNGYLYGVIDNQDGNITISIYLLADGVFNQIGFASQHIIANSKPNNLLDKSARN